MAICGQPQVIPTYLHAGHFVGIENFAWTARFLGLPETASLAELEAAGQQHCSLQWPALQQQHEGRNLSTALMLQFCFR